jgi:hypothetical protein
MLTRKAFFDTACEIEKESVSGYFQDCSSALAPLHRRLSAALPSVKRPCDPARDAVSDIEQLCHLEQLRITPTCHHHAANFERESPRHMSVRKRERLTGSAGGFWLGL